MVTAGMVLSRLPPYFDQWQLIKKEQYVPDIIKEVVASHKLFGEYYDRFSDLFYHPNVSVVADTLYDFCKDNIAYREETVEMQTSALPTGIIERGYGDCKHYALFCAGVISSLNRMYNCCYRAEYCFVSYRKGTEPYHVFVRVLCEDVEIWLDPTPGSGGIPVLMECKPV